MRPFAGRGLEVPKSIEDALTAYLRLAGSKLSPAEALGQAVKTWIAHEREIHPDRVESVRGYQWKTLFLPESTELSMVYGDQTYHARVVANDIMFEGRSVSPRGMTLAIAGEGRNAWRDLRIRLPGERGWKRASACRAALARIPSTPAHMPAASDSIAAAAAAMTDALRTALTLVEHAHAQASRPVERRVERQRRDGDLLGTDCPFD